MKIHEIVIARDFTDSPGARYRSDGKFSGQEFYEDILKPKLSNVWNTDDEKLLLDFDNTLGYASSFVSEVFLRTVRDFGDKKKILKKIDMKSEDDKFLIQAILDEINES